MIFVAFLVPLALYLLLLSAINRRPRPVVLSGTWDFIGLLFASSGFLLVGGPAILTSLSESWRLFWLLGEGHPLRDSFLTGSALWLILPAVYFLAVVAGGTWLWRRYRPLTSIYNVDPACVDDLLADICQHLGLGPIRSGNVLVFGLPAEAGEVRRTEGLQGPHAPLLVPAEAPAPTRAPVPAAGPGELFVGQSAVLEVEPFEALKHVTLRWGPHDSPLRLAIESELERRLAEVDSPYHDTAVWMNFTAWGMLCLSLLILVLLAIRMILAR